MSPELLTALVTLITAITGAVVTIIVALKGKAAAELGTRQNAALGAQNEALNAQQFNPDAPRVASPPPFPVVPAATTVAATPKESSGE